ncbi:MAG: histone deacetylase [Thermodesulfobacteriota bacterium]
MSRTIAVARDDRFLLHKTGHSHPESPTRLSSIYRMLDQFFDGQLLTVTPRPVTLDQVELVHTPGHVRKLLKTAEQKVTSLAPDSPVSSQSYLAAWLAAGACVQGIDHLMNGDCRAFFALVRPPGHHALPDRTMGFCLLNNLAIAARYAQMRYSPRRILIIDWDAHHGNGLQQVFYGEKEVFYLSSHDPAMFPYSGGIADTGEGRGRGFTLNMPLPRDLTDADVDFLYRAVLPAVFEGYNPELILVAAGFDAHADDPLGRFLWTENAYFLLTSLIVRLTDRAGGIPVLLSLEGGYDPGANAASVRAVLNALVTADEAAAVGDSVPAHPEQVHELLESVFATHRPLGVLS